jgi:hypothetical protein
MKLQIKVDPALMARSLEFAQRSVLGYERGEKEASRAHARPGIDKSVDEQMKGKAGECAFCQFVGVSPLTELDWTPKTDLGWDLIWRTRKIDVKTTDTSALIWPVTKGWLEECKANVFVLVRRIAKPRRDELADNIALQRYDTFEISGWITVKDFIAQHRVADEQHRFDTGTKYMPAETLTEFTEAARAGYRNGFVGFTHEGHFTAFCHCGKLAPYGYGVSLIRNQLGTHYCREHRPKP